MWPPVGPPGRLSVDTLKASPSAHRQMARAVRHLINSRSVSWRCTHATDLSCRISQPAAAVSASSVSSPDSTGRRAVRVASFRELKPGPGGHVERIAGHPGDRPPGRVGGQELGQLGRLVPGQDGPDVLVVGGLPGLTTRPGVGQLGKPRVPRSTATPITKRRRIQWTILTLKLGRSERQRGPSAYISTPSGR